MVKGTNPQPLLVRTLIRIGNLNAGEGPVGFGATLAKKYVADDHAVWVDENDKRTKGPMEAVRKGEEKARPHRPEVDVTDDGGDAEEGDEAETSTTSSRMGALRKKVAGKR